MDPRAIALIVFQGIRQELAACDQELSDREAEQILQRAVSTLPDLSLEKDGSGASILRQRSSGERRPFPIMGAAEALRTVWNDYLQDMEEQSA